MGIYNLVVVTLIFIHFIFFCEKVWFLALFVCNWLKSVIRFSGQLGRSERYNQRTEHNRYIYVSTIKFFKTKVRFLKFQIYIFFTY